MRKGSGTPTASMQMSIGKAHQPKKHPMATDHTCRWAPHLSYVAAAGNVLGPPAHLVHDRYRQADVEWQRHCEEGEHVQGRAAIDPLLGPVEQRDRHSRKLEEEQPHSQERADPAESAQPFSFRRPCSFVAHGCVEKTVAHVGPGELLRASSLVAHDNFRVRAKPSGQLAYLPE